MENWRDMLGRANKLMEEIKALHENAEATAEEKNKIPEMLAEVKRLQADAGRLKEIEVTATEMERQMKDAGAAGQKETGAFKSWPEFVEAVWRQTHPLIDMRREDPRVAALRFREQEPRRRSETKQMVESVGASGGFLIPTEFQAQLQAVVGESAIVRPRSTVIRMARRALQIPVLNQTGTTAGIPHWFGGMQAFWAEEATEKTLTEAEFRQIEMVAHKLIMYTRASDELLDDSAISLSDFLSGPMGFAGCINWMEDYSFLQGTGAGQPLGVITAVNRPTIVVARAAAGAVGFADLANMMASFLPSGRGVWVVTQSAMASIIQLSGPAGNPSYIWQPNAREGIPGSILGFPVIWSEKVPVLGTQGDVLLADFRYYLVGDRQATTIESTEYDYWRLDQTSWRAVHRVDGQPWLSSPLTYQDGTTTVSPFVILGGVGGS